MSTLERDVGLRHHAFEPILSVHDRQATHLMLCHQLKGVRKIVIGSVTTSPDEISLKAFSRILPFGDRSNDDVSSPSTISR